MTTGPTLIKGVQAEYIPVTAEGARPGMTPFGKHLVVKVDPCSPRSGGLIELPPDFVEKMTAASETGCIVAVGQEAFMYYEDGTRWTGDKPKVGDRIGFARYSGELQRGADGEMYRVMSYTCVTCVRNEIDAPVLEGRVVVLDGQVIELPELQTAERA